jgi:hypothetical protein
MRKPCCGGFFAPPFVLRRKGRKPVILSGDGLGGDLGYPSTVELADGSLLTVWYEVMAGHPHAVLRQAKWRLG